MKRSISVVSIAVGLIVALAGCSSAPATQGSHGSRAAIYSSIDEMLKDTTDVVVGRVVDEVVVEPKEEGGIVVTLATLEISDTYTPANVGTAWADKGYHSSSLVSGNKITVRQMGASTHVEAPAPFLATGTDYLLFLNPAALEGEAADQYTVVGVVAGIYVQEGPDRFVWMPETEQFRAGPTVEEALDRLPTTLTPADLG